MNKKTLQQRLPDSERLIARGRQFIHETEVVLKNMSEMEAILARG